MGFHARLRELGYELPGVAKPLASYVPAVRVGDQVWTSGQLPLVEGALPLTGKVGAEVTTEQAQEQARIAALNALAAIDAEVGLDNVSRVVKIVGFVASDSAYADQPVVINGASDFIGEVFGDAGKHARSAVGVAALPKNAPVEIELIVEIAA
ncbi:RidA family protein [Corynebacterium marquesiae]|uniref:RidA family protein n=1 Tax=Corynebacterium marquesiae TaxID=2913503 RepID=UPI001EF58F90|nr:RidA family protein [Corynebacterium marquesiae]MCG7448192.1 RidA family protein [Corynebacterium aurimucosum]MDK8454753.1 RidA family protein [Corynebacterium marquesiae]MDK8480901.1 RidA family protein [Corynebacterium marquesiae]MDK8531619.1 RidA family protein [Corynebacterium marquesiae]MDK8724872.1 RidA family protein [Corynebacterium marquesiae]